MLYTRTGRRGRAALHVPAAHGAAALRLAACARSRAARGRDQPRLERPWRVFRTVTLPLSMPGALTGCIFVFVPAMCNFVIPELLGGGKTILIGNLVRDQFLEARDWPFGATLALVLTVIPGARSIVLQQRARAGH